MDRCCCVWRANDNSQGFSLVSLLGVAQLEPAPFAQHPTLLVVGKGYSVMGPLGRAFFQVITAARTASAKRGRYSLSANALSGIAPNEVEKKHGDNRRHPLLHRGIGNARFSQVSMHQ